MQALHHVKLDDLPCNIEPAGDYDGSGGLEVSDVVKLLRSLRQNSEDPCLDYNGDGSSNIMDALDLLLEIARN